jgi:hypothetical protein
MLTSSGVLAWDSLGNTYMAVASHGFPGAEAYHPHSVGRGIGELIME